MHGDIAESRHAAKGLGGFGVNQALALQQDERGSTALRHPQASFGHNMHRHIDRGLTGSFDVKGEGIQMGKIVVFGTGFSFLAKATNATLDDCRFVVEDIVSRHRHRESPFGFPEVRHTSRAPAWRTGGVQRGCARRKVFRERPFPWRKPNFLCAGFLNRPAVQ